MDTYNYKTMTREIFETYIKPNFVESKSNNKGQIDKYHIFLYILYKIENCLKWRALDDIDILGDGTKLKHEIVYYYYKKWAKDTKDLDKQYLDLVKLYTECVEDKKK